jgi:hypothetical protein
MYLAFAPRSIAEVGTIVELSEKIVAVISTKTLALVLISLVTMTPMVKNCRMARYSYFTKQT